MCFFQLNVQWPKGARMWAFIFEGANMCTKPLPWMQAWNETNNFCPWTWNPHTDRVWQAGLVTLGMEVSWGKAQGALLQDAHKMCKRAHLFATPCPWSTCRHMQSTCWEKAGECGKPGALGQKAWSSVRGIRAFSPCTVSAPETERTLPPWHCHSVLLSLYFQWRMWLTSSPNEQLEGTLNNHKAEGVFQLSDRTVTSSARANGMGQSVQTVLHITLQPLDIIWIQQPLLFNSSSVPVLYCLWAGSKCYHSSRGASLSRSH